uniref:Uncharacterized protein n=1 Tax=Romanomermis culicivorax TaxID=13658 RepID=A0A915ID86_ROMCU
MVASSGRCPRRCGGSERQCAAHSSCCRITVNDDDRSPKTGSVTIPDGNPPRSRKIGVLHEVQPCGGLVIDFPEEDPVLSDNDDEEGSRQT